jgi:DNA-binding transcriptional regulator YdaS (Cro superfamily)
MSGTPLERAAEIVGGQTALAKRIGTSQGQVWWWINRSRHRRAPAEFVLPIEAATDGQVPRYELRPDLYPQRASSDGAASLSIEPRPAAPVETGSAE